MYIYVCWQCYPLVWAFHPRYTQAYWSSFKYFRQTHQHLEADRIEFTDEDVISILLYGSKTWTLLKADERRLEAFHVNCQWRILGIRWFHFVTNASVTSQTGEEGLAIRICRKWLSIFGHVRRLPEATPAHSALHLAVDARTGGKPDIRPEWSASEDDPAECGCSRSRTTLGSTPTMPGGSHMTASLGRRYDPWPVKRSTDWLTDWYVFKWNSIGLTNIHRSYLCSSALKSKSDKLNVREPLSLHI